SKKAKSTEPSKGTTKLQSKSNDKSAQAEEIVFEARDTQVPHNLGEDMDPEWNECKTFDNKPTQKWLSDLAKAEKPSKTFDDLMSTLTNFSALNDQLDWNNPEGDRYPFDLSKPLILVQLRNRQIAPVNYFFNNDLAYLQGGSNGKTHMTSMTKTKAANNLDKKWSRIMVKDIDRHLLERRLMRSLEKFISGKEYEEDLRLLQRTI
nr:hypothetical protein [Tanacetum cinerariifolium]